MRRLVWGIVIGTCGITCLMLGAAQQAMLPGALQVNTPTPSLPLIKPDQTVVTGNKAPEAPVVTGISPVPVVKELAAQSMTPAGGSVVPVSTPAAPAPIARTPEKTDQPVVENEMMSIDTMDLEQPEGNWLNKRVWWERAKDKYKECREVFEAIFASRMAFLEKRSQVEKTIFDPFYRDMGLEHAELRQVVTSLIDYIEEEREETGSLTEKERTFLDKVTAAKKDLEQVKLDVDAINNIDDAIDKAVNTLSNKINEAHRFEQSAWDEFDAIAHELSDKRAHDRYYVIDGIHKNLKDLQKYISAEYTTYFDGLVKAAQDKTERAKKEVKGLKDQDINLEDQAKLLVAEDQAQEDEEAKRAAQKAAEEAKKAAEAAKLGILGKTWKWLVGALKSLWNLLFGWWLYKL